MQVAIVLGRSGSSVVSGHRARCIDIGHSLAGNGGFSFGHPQRGKDMLWFLEGGTPVTLLGPPLAGVPGTAGMNRK